MPDVRKYLLLAAGLLAACGDDLADPTDSNAIPEANTAISQGVNGFYWLPPMVPDPAPFGGTFDANRAPTVTITCAGAASPSCPQVARFTFGTGSSNVKLDPVGQNYSVNWKAPSNLVLGQAKYRVVVTDGATTLGEALLWVVTSSKEANALKGKELAVIRGSPFLIKFRIEVGAGQGGSIEITPSASIMVVGEVVQLAAIQKDQNGGVIPGDPVTWSSSDPAVATVSTTGLLAGVATGSVTIRAVTNARQAQAGVVVGNLPPPANGSIGGAGGALAAALSNGGSLRINVPAGAVNGPTPFGIAPTLRAPGARTSFRFSPPGTIFGLPIELIYSPPAGTTETSPLFITWPGAAGKGIIPLQLDAATGTWKGLARLLGDLPIFSAVRARTAAMLRAEGDGQQASVGSVTFQDIIDATRMALDAFMSDPTMPHARVLYNSIEVFASMRLQPGFPPEGDLVLLDWRPAVCDRAEAETVLFESQSVGPPMDIAGYIAAIDRMLQFVATAEQASDAQLQLPFLGCPAGTPPYAAALATKSVVFVARVPDLVAPPGTDFLARFDEMLDVQLPRILQLTAALELVGISSFSSTLQELGGAIATSLREAAWRACRERGDQGPMGRLVGFEQIAESVTPFELHELVADLAGCTTELAWRVRPADLNGNGPAESSGALVPSGPGTPVPTATVTLPSTSEIVIAGQVHPIACPLGSGPGAPSQLNEERLVVTARLGITSVEMASKDLPASDPRVHLHQDSVKVTAAALRQAVQAVGDASIELAVDRVGMTCEGLYQSFPSVSRLATLTIESDEGQCPAGAAALRASGGAARVAASCVIVSISPAMTTLNLNQNRVFTPTVLGATNPAVTWSATAGTITSLGVYTATSLGSHTVRATSVQDPTVFASATVSVVGSGNVIVSPLNSGNGFGRTRQYTVLSGAGPFTWSADGGTITQTGLYTAGFVEGEYSIRATGSQGTGVASAIVDAYVGNWRGSFTRDLPIAFQANDRVLNIVRQLIPDIGCASTQDACYATSEQDFGNINLGGCFFRRASLAQVEAVGACAQTSTSNGGTLTVAVQEGVLEGTLEYTFQGQVVERWRFRLTRQ